jgi:Dockerin type I domain
MKTPNELPRVRRRRCLAPDLLEDRMVLSASQGSTFAIMPATVATAGQVSTVPFTMSSSLFTPAAKMHGKMLLGIDVTAVAQQTSATSNTPANPPVEPEIVSVTGPDGRKIPIQHTHYYPKIARANHLKGPMDITSAVLLTMPVPASGQAPVNYTVQVRGIGSSTGQYLLGFYLPGDTAGTGTITKTDVTTVKSLLGDAATNSNYNFDADVNRDGIINGQDVRLVQKNLGASTQVSPVVSVNLDPASDPNSDRTTPYSTVHFAGKTTPGATVTFADQANNNATTTTTADSTGAYSIMVPLVPGSNTFTVTTKDAFGQSISGAISPVVYSPTSAANTPGTATTGS